MEVEISKIDTIIDTLGQTPQGLIPTLLAVQDEYHYLPQEAIHRVSERMKIPLIQVHQVAEFYKAFSLEPRGKHIVTVCLGTACHVQGGSLLLDQIGRTLNIEAGETTQDMQFTLEAVNCLGACALGPVMTVDKKYFGNMTASKVNKVLDQYIKREEIANG